VIISVDLDVCQNYGQCVFAAPEVFDLDDNAELVYQGEAPESSRGEVGAAVAACPVQAIRIVSQCSDS
jgi:ferredoxin